MIFFYQKLKHFILWIVLILFWVSNGRSSLYLIERSSRDYEFELSVTLYFKFKNNEIRYLEVDIDTQHTVDISGYDAIYAYLQNRIKERLTTQLGVLSYELTNESILLYRMMAI